MPQTSEAYINKKKHTNIRHKDLLQCRGQVISRQKVCIGTRFYEKGCLVKRLQNLPREPCIKFLLDRIPPGTRNGPQSVRQQLSGSYNEKAHCTNGE